MLKKKIFTPGPTQVHPEVLKSVISNFTYHRSSEFSEFYKHLIVKLKDVYFTSGFINVLTTSGTGAMEAAVVNFCRKDSNVLYINQGRFGARWGEICRAFGIKASEITIPPGETAELIHLKKFNLKQFDAVFLTHSETSTATLTDISTITDYIKTESDALVIVDSISSIGTIEFRMDEWNIDIAVSASQKGFMSPPGLAVIAYSEKAYERMLANNMPRYFFNLENELKSLEKYFTNWTPAIGIMYGLDKACDILISEGIENKWKMSAKIAELFRNECISNGFGIFSNHPVDSLTAVTIPGNIPTGKLIKVIKEKYGVQLANGQNELKDKIFRVSHMGDINLEDTAELLKIIFHEYKLLL